MRVIVCLLGILLLPGIGTAIEVATGSMLGPRYKQTRFYVKNSAHSAWHETYSGREYRSKARGKLMMVGVANGLFHDEWMTEYEFDPEENTARLIEALDEYKAHGIWAIRLSLQGGNPGYDPAANRIARKNEARLGSQGGLSVSAFHPDGSLKEDWLGRLERVLKATNERGMLVCLTYFYHGQDEVFESRRAIVAATRNVTDWLIENNYRNVIIDVASEWDLGGYHWDHARFIPENLGRLVDEIRERFIGAEFLLPIGASVSSKMSYPASLARWCDVVLLHGNGRKPSEKMARAKALEEHGRPVLMVADDNGRELSTADLSREKASAEALFQQGSGWGYSPWAQAQRFPFAYRPAASSSFDESMSLPDREGHYFRAVLEQIASLVLKDPPTTAAVGE